MLGAKISVPLMARESRPMRSHRAILSSALKEKGLTHKAVGAMMGISPATVGHKLRGIRDWESGELAKMAEIAGMTLLMLAEQSDDLFLAKHTDTLEAAVILDDLAPEDRAAAVEMIKAMKRR